MRWRSVMTFALLLLLATTACQPSPPTVVYVVVTPTPTDASAVSFTPTATQPMPTTSPTSINAPATTTLLATSTPDAFPTQTVAQVQVAEQVFEGGRMFWLQPVAQIWVLIVDEEGGGRWLRYEDTFVEGTDLEIDPALNAPEGMIQPERGFGKLWRETPNVRDALGWAITPEFGYISEYRYMPGGQMQSGDYIAGPGWHMLLSLNSEAFCFFEETGLWRLGC